MPKSLARQGVDVIRMMPLYQEIDRELHGIVPCEEKVHVPLGDSWFEGTVWYQYQDGVTTYFIQSEEFFERSGIYGSGGHGYGDNFERFLFFQKAAVRLIDTWGLLPDLVHCNDWQTGLTPMLLQHGIDGTPRAGKEKTLFTIHNLAHQGWAPADKFYMTGLPPACYTMHTLEFYGEINTLKGGVVAASAVSTVSPTYAREIQTRLFGCQLEGVMKERADELYGILNGVDYSVWNPETDPYIAGHYSCSNLAGKRACKAHLQKLAGLEQNPKKPILGMVSRLVSQKGIDLLVGAVDRMMETDAQLVLLGTGDAHYEQVCREWNDRWPGKVCVWIEFSEEKAHQIEAGSDVFMMPSDFEPCGQNQLYSMRYGTLPLVHGVGGLEDTVKDVMEPDSTGFKFHGYHPNTFFHCIERALKLYDTPRKWSAMVKRAMQQDHSNVHMAKDYIALYKKIIRGHETLD